ncbi:transmembrane protein 51 [Eublepharis macularius]|uniref:Transmembrane protein 51 n=1 Tax=Eublepharis macularius TaxID=481883 RepID=A0AA97LLK7_EUBMA|nr:transmembrane protein 51 [Eublepharis macularius]XP_054856982.1 transmembrane protein 51 [Eublepharis macularius]
MAHSRSSGSHYALTAIGLGMLVLGVIMAVWNLVPGFSQNSNTSTGNSSKTHPERANLKSKTFSVAYVLIGAGVLLLMFSVCLSIRDRRRERQNECVSRIRRETSVEHQQQEDSQDEDVETPSRYYVPSYEEVMSTDYPDLREVDRSTRISVSLPSYESLTGIDETTPTRPAAAAEAGPNAERQPSRRSSRLSKRLKPLKIRRIKSEKLHLKDIHIKVSDANSSGRVTIEPLTPPPQYEDVPHKLPDSRDET